MFVSGKFDLDENRVCFFSARTLQNLGFEYIEGYCCSSWALESALYAYLICVPS